MQDTLRSDAIEAISQLKAMGVSAVMLTRITRVQPLLSPVPSAWISVPD